MNCPQLTDQVILDLMQKVEQGVDITEQQKMTLIKKAWAIRVT